MTEPVNKDAEHIKVGKAIIKHLENGSFPIKVAEILKEVGIKDTRFKKIMRDNFSPIFLYNTDEITGFHKEYKSLNEFEETFEIMEKRSRGQWGNKKEIEG